MPEIRSNDTRESPAKMPAIAAKPAGRPFLIAKRRRRKVSAPGDMMMTSDERIKGTSTLVSTTGNLSLAGTV